MRYTGIEQSISARLQQINNTQPDAICEIIVPETNADARRGFNKPVIKIEVLDSSFSIPRNKIGVVEQTETIKIGVSITDQKVIKCDDIAFQVQRLLLGFMPAYSYQGLQYGTTPLLLSKMEKGRSVDSQHIILLDFITDIVVMQEVEQGPIILITEINYNINIDG